MNADKRLRDLVAFDRSNPIFSVNLTMQQLKVLLLLSRQDGIASHELAHHLGVTLATLSGIIDRLATQSYVTRTEDVNDRRVRRIHLAPAGRTAMEEIMDRGTKAQQKLLNRLDDETLEMLETVLIRIMVAAHAEALDQGIVLPPQNDCPDATSLEA